MRLRARRWSVYVAAGVMLVVPLRLDADAPVEDPLTRLAQQLVEPQVADTVAATPDRERLPLVRQPLTEASSTQVQGQSRPTWGSGWVLNTVTALGVVLLVIFALRAALSRLGRSPLGAGRQGAVEVIGRIMIAPRNHVLLLRVGGRVLVVGDSATGLRTLDRIDDPAEVASILGSTAAAAPHSVTRGFTHLLGRFNRDFDDRDRLADEGGDHAEHTIDQARNRVSSLLARVRTASPPEAAP